ncbi:MAG: type II secretion system F family protein [Candidatus Omnitrophica bacterium]|nr:type II secretion system F family protein [Candidatus Omnitrophota bacterium]
MRYRYTALALDGRQLHGEIDASGTEEAATCLQEAGVYPTRILARTTRRPPHPSSRFDPSQEERIFLLDSLVFFLEAGFTLPSALLRLSLRVRNPSFARELEGIMRAIEGGGRVTEAFREASLLPPSWDSILAVGEVQGDLVPSLKLLRQHAMEDARLKSDLASTLVMPTVLLGLVGIWFLVVAHRVLPTLETFLGSLALDVSDFSSVVILGEVIRLMAPWVLPAACLIFFLLRRYVGAAAETEFLDGRLSSLFPLAGGLVSQARRVDLFSGIRLQMEAGIPVVRTFQNLAAFSRSHWRRKGLLGVAGEIQEGIPLAEALERHGLISANERAILAAGEAGGHLTEMFGYLLCQTQEGLREQINRFAILLRSVVTLSVGFLIGFMLIAFLWILASTAGGALDIALDGQPPAAF